MGFFESVVNWFTEWEARKFGKGCARAMLFSANVMKHKYEGQAPTYAWLARKALLTRPNWNQLDGTRFTFSRSGQVIDITDDMSVMDVVHRVIEVELSHNLASVPTHRSQHLKGLAHEAADAYVGNKRGASLLLGGRSEGMEKAEEIIRAMHSYYRNVRSRFPREREIFYLASAWAIYAKKHHPEQYKDYDLTFLLAAGAADTAVFSFLRPPDSIEALAIFMVHKERLPVASEYEAKFSEIMGRLPVDEAHVMKKTEGLTKYVLAQGVALEGTSVEDFGKLEPANSE